MAMYVDGVRCDFLMIDVVEHTVKPGFYATSSAADVDIHFLTRPEPEPEGD